MAKDHSSKSLARTSYEKITKVTFGSFRRSSPGPKNGTPNRPTSASGPTTPIPNPPPIESSRPLEGPKPFKKFVRFMSSSDTKKTGDGGGGKEVVGQKTFSEEKYNSYIDHTKMKMRAPSAVSGGGGGRTISRRETFNDMFSGYINRTKMRLRTTSSVGNDGKTVSPK
ncbi:hypothetical protein OSB04_022941 [Centaurea solstitialis]|uniref:Uncharacterized protein n=1 Tax=Centaurea solstitialis TaxID=347529 RepID=A0AA38SJV5_9ASTR|nr:hypothetical protein OSB04_022941 [Centaurea solstitialis]